MSRTAISPAPALLLRCLGAALLALPAAATPQDETPETGFFQKLGLYGALERAKDEGRLVLVAWMRDDDPECRRMDRSTWSDPELREWVSEAAVPIRLTEKDNLELTRQMNVGQFPSCVYLRPDASEVTRLIGFFEPEDFVTQSEAKLTGRVGGVVPRPVMEKSNDPYAWLAYGNSLMDDQNLPVQALDAYIWCLDNGELHVPGFRARYLDYLLERISEMRKSNRMAASAMTLRRDRLADSILKGEATQESVHEFLRFSYWLRDQETRTRIFDGLRDGNEAQLALRQQLFEGMLQHLVDNRRYEDVVACGGDILGKLRTGFEALGEDETRRADLVNEAACYYEALLDQGRGGDAKEIETMVLTASPTGRSYALLMDSALRLNLYGLVRRLAEEGKEKVAPRGRRMIARTLERAEVQERTGKPAGLTSSHGGG